MRGSAGSKTVRQLGDLDETGMNLSHQHDGAQRCTRPKTFGAGDRQPLDLRGASPTATTTWAAITWSGRETWSKRRRADGGRRLPSTRRESLHYMQTQEADGHWAQNMWLDGTPYWSGIQMDEAGIPDPAGRPGVSRRADRRRD